MQVMRDKVWVDIPSLFDAFSGEEVRKGPGHPSGQLFWEIVDCGMTYEGATLADAIRAWENEHPHIEVYRNKVWVTVPSLADILPGERFRNGKTRTLRSPSVFQDNVTVRGATIEAAVNNWEGKSG